MAVDVPDRMGGVADGADFEVARRGLEDVASPVEFRRAYTGRTREAAVWRRPGRSGEGRHCSSS